MARTERLEARIAPEARDKIQQAADRTGMSTSAFVVDAALDRAERILRRERETVVSAEYFDRLLASLDEPSKPIPRLRKAANLAKELVTPIGEDSVPDSAPRRRPRRR